MQLLAKAVLAMAGVMLLDVVRSVLKLETSSTEADLQESLTGLTVRHLKDLCGELQAKTCSTKAVLIGELVTFWKRQNAGESSAEHQVSFASTVDTVYCATRPRVGQGNICRNSTAKSRSQVVKIRDIVLADTLHLSAMSCSNSPKRKRIKTANSSSAMLS